MCPRAGYEGAIIKNIGADGAVAPYLLPKNFLQLKVGNTLFGPTILHFSFTSGLPGPYDGLPQVHQADSLFTETTALMLLWVVLAALNKSGFFSSFSLFLPLIACNRGSFPALVAGCKSLPETKAFTEKKPSKSYPSVAACFLQKDQTSCVLDTGSWSPTMILEGRVSYGSELLLMF